MKTLTIKEMKKAELYAIGLLKFLKSSTDGLEVVKNRKLSKALNKLRLELSEWGFDL